MKDTRRAVVDLAGCVGAAARLGADWVTATQQQAEWGQQGLSDEEVEERLEQDRMAGLGELGCWALGLFSLQAAGAAGDTALAAPYMAVRITQMGHGKTSARAVSGAQLHQIMLCVLLPHACLPVCPPVCCACWAAAALRHKTAPHLLCHYACSLPAGAPQRWLRASSRSCGRRMGRQPLLEAAAKKNRLQPLQRWPPRC